jgi:hypothetical protein
METNTEFYHVCTTEAHLLTLRIDMNIVYVYIYTFFIHYRLTLRYCSCFKEIFIFWEKISSSETGLDEYLV